MFEVMQLFDCDIEIKACPIECSREIRRENRKKKEKNDCNFIERPSNNPHETPTFIAPLETSEDLTGRVYVETPEVVLNSRFTLETSEI